MIDIILQGIKLNQQQLDAIVSVVNDHLAGRISRKNFDGACLDAMAKAGCPLIHEDEEGTDAAS